MEGLLLLVDDELSVLDILSEYFVAQSYDVQTASNGDDALKRVADRRPDLVLPVQLGDLDSAADDAVAAAVGAARRALPTA